jgi:hypothetical protein
VDDGVGSYIGERMSHARVNSKYRHVKKKHGGTKSSASSHVVLRPAGAAALVMHILLLWLKRQSSLQGTKSSPPQETISKTGRVAHLPAVYPLIITINAMPALRYHRASCATGRDTARQRNVTRVCKVVL